MEITLELLDGSSMHTGAFVATNPADEPITSGSPVKERQDSGTTIVGGEFRSAPAPAPGWALETQMLSRDTVLESQMGRLREELARDKIKPDPDSRVHTFRHMFQAEAGSIRRFALQYAPKVASA